MQVTLDSIIRRHIFRCLSKIEEVHKLPSVCADQIKKEIIFTARDVSDMLTERHQDDDDDTETNQRH